MQPWRFDDLTRTLGKATSRRQVVKGVLGGLIGAAGGRAITSPSVAAAGCSVRKCKEDALKETFLYQSTNCKSICQDPKLVLGCIGCQITANRLHRQWVKDCETGDGCLAVTGETCCGTACVDLTHDPSNCGACGNVCSPGETCQGGQCTCGDQGLVCNGQCIDPQMNAQHCGSCDHACAVCETCQGGQCVAVECGAGELCCHDQCIDVTSDHDNCGGCGVVCGEQQVCLHRSCQCPTTTCPSGKTLDPNTCQCVCSSTCPTGQSQDPDTCQCQDRCKGVTCGECQTCDPTSGDCVQADDQTPCGTNQVCCSGVCKDSCNPCAGQPDTTPCGSGKICCGQVCQSGESCNPCGSDPAYSKPCTNQYGTVCCPNDATCCAGNGNICGPDAQNNNVCCDAGTYQCDDSCCDDPSYCTPVTHHPDWPAVCCQSMATDSDGNCCEVGEVAEDCSDTPDGPVTSAVCCAVTTIQNGGSCCP